MGGRFTSFSDLNYQLQKWLSRVNSIPNGTTHEVPIERLSWKASRCSGMLRPIIIVEKRAENFQGLIHLLHGQPLFSSISICRDDSKVANF